VAGYEDCRLFESGGRWYALATVRDRNPDEVCEIALLGLDGPRIERVTILPGPEPGRDEKNWMPFAAHGGTGIVYSCGPTRILRLDPGSGRVRPGEETGAPAWTAGLRGGSQGLPVEGGHLFAVHEVLWEDGGRLYVHRLVLIDGAGRLAAASRRFSFTGDPIEHCAGIARRGERLVFSFGVGDRSAALALLPESEALSMPEPVAAT
jgi:hypothetical protein